MGRFKHTLFSIDDSSNILRFHFFKSVKKKLGSQERGSQFCLTISIKTPHLKLNYGVVLLHACTECTLSI